MNKKNVLLVTWVRIEIELLWSYSDGVSDVPLLVLLYNELLKCIIGSYKYGILTKFRRFKYNKNSEIEEWCE